MALPEHRLVLTSGRRVRLRPLPLGFPRTLLSRGLVPPEPPVVVCRDARGQAIRDERGLAVMRTAAADAKYLLAKARYDERVAVITLRESVIEGLPELTESPTPDGCDDWSTVADGWIDQLSAAGITTGDFLALCRGVSEASGLIDAAYQTARDQLFPDAATSSTTPRPDATPIPSPAHAVSTGSSSALASE